MATALVLLNVKRQQIKEVSQKLVDMQEVSEVYRLQDVTIWWLLCG